MRPSKSCAKEAHLFSKFHHRARRCAGQIFAVFVALCPAPTEAEPFREIAQWHLDWTPGAQRAALQVIDQLDQADPVRTSVSAMILPSSNVAGTTHHRQFALPGGQIGQVTGAAPKFGLRLGARAGLRMTRVVGPGQRIVADMALNLARPGPSVTGQASVRAVRIRSRRTDWVELTAQYDSRKAGMWGVALGHRRALAPGRAVDLDFRIQHHVSAQKPAHNGQLAQAQARLSWQNRPDLGWQLGATLQHRTAQRAHNGYRGIGADLTLIWHPSGVGALDAQIALAARQYAQVTPGLGRLRRDADLTVAVGWRSKQVRILGTAPRLSCQWTQTRSTIALYETRAASCGLQLSLDF